MKPVRIALVGLGVRGNHWRTAVEENPDASVLGVVEVRPVEVGEVPVFKTVEQSLEARPDGVIVATPPETHLGLVEAFLNAGVPVLCEKPLSERFDEAQSMVELADRTSTPLLVGMNFRYVPASRGLRQVLKARNYGDPMFGQFTYIRNRDGRRADLNDYPLTMADPMLIDQSIHHLDLMRYVYGREVESVSATTWNPTGSVYAGNSCVAANLTFQGGLVVSYMGTWTSGTNRFDFRWRTDLEKGVLIQAEQFGDVLFAARDAESGLTGPLFDSETEVPRQLGFGPSTPFVDDTAGLLAHFIAVIEEGTEPEPSGADHLLTLNLIESIKEAAENRCTISPIERARLLGLRPPRPAGS